MNATLFEMTVKSEMNRINREAEKRRIYDEMVHDPGTAKRSAIGRAIGALRESLAGEIRS